MNRLPLKRKTPLKRGQARRRKRRPAATKRQLATMIAELQPMAETARMLDAVRGTSYSRRPRDWDRMTWCRSLPCALHRPGAPSIELWRGPPDVDACCGEVQAHHAGEHGYGNKAPDDTCLPLCEHHHGALTDRRGCFSGWPQRSLKAWELAMVEVYQRAYAEHLAGRDYAPF